MSKKKDSVKTTPKTNTAMSAAHKSPEELLAQALTGEGDDSVWEYARVQGSFVPGNVRHTDGTPCLWVLDDYADNIREWVKDLEEGSLTLISHPSTPIEPELGLVQASAETVASIPDAYIEKWRQRGAAVNAVRITTDTFQMVDEKVRVDGRTLPLTDAHIGRYALFDAYGDFWRLMEADELHRHYEPVGAADKATSVSPLATTPKESEESRREQQFEKWFTSQTFCFDKRRAQDAWNAALDSQTVGGDAEKALTEIRAVLDGYGRWAAKLDAIETIVSGELGFGEKKD